MRLGAPGSWFDVVSKSGGVNSVVYGPHRLSRGVTSAASRRSFATLSARVCAVGPSHRSNTLLRASGVAKRERMAIQRSNSPRRDARASTLRAYKYGTNAVCFARIQDLEPHHTPSPHGVTHLRSQHSVCRRQAPARHAVTEAHEHHAAGVAQHVQRMQESPWQVQSR